MLPLSCYDNKVYNILLNWVKSHKRNDNDNETIAVKFDNSNKVINVYTNHPGIMIGYQGQDLNNVLKSIRACRGYEDYNIKFVEVCMFINTNDSEVTDEQHNKDWKNYMAFRFGDAETDLSEFL